MRFRRFHHPVAWFCLIWFGLANTLMASGVVVCQDGHGDSRVEWGCSQNDRGECASRCGDASEPEQSGSCDQDESRPCRDVPVEMDGQVQRHRTDAAAKDVQVFPVAVPAVVLPWGVGEPPAGVWGTRRFITAEHPPDTLRCLRSVVLLV